MEMEGAFKRIVAKEGDTMEMEGVFWRILPHEV